MKDCCEAQDTLADELDELAADPTLQVGGFLGCLCFAGCALWFFALKSIADSSSFKLFRVPLW